MVHNCYHILRCLGAFIQPPPSSDLRVPFIMCSESHRRREKSRRLGWVVLGSRMDLLAFIFNLAHRPFIQWNAHVSVEEFL